MPIRKIGRDAGSGRFIPVAEAEQRPVTAVVEIFRVCNASVRRLKRTCGGTASKSGTDLRTGGGRKK